MTIWHSLLAPNQTRLRTRLAYIQLLSVIIILLGLLVTDRIRFEADILSLLPQDSSVNWQQAENAFFRANQSKIVMSFVGEDAEGAYDQVADFAKRQQWKSTQEDIPSLTDIVSFYSQYRGMILSGQDRQVLEQGDSLSSGIFEKLSESLNPFVQASFDQDPSLTISNFIEQSFTTGNGITIKEGRFVKSAAGQDVLILIVQLPPDAIGVEASQRHAHAILEQLSTTQSTFPQVQIRYSGPLFHNAENASQASYEMTLFGSLSLLAMLVLVIYCFRHFSALLAVAVTLLNAFLSGLLAMVLLFDHVHIISFVFGITLIGIAIDYCFHFLTDIIERRATLTGEEQEQASPISFEVRSSIWLGFISTVVGYALFAFTPIGFFAQVATFIIFGLTGAVISVFAIVPGLTKQINGHQTLVALGSRIALFLQVNRRRLQLAIMSIAIMLCASLWFNPLSFNDNIALMTTSSDKLLDNERVHRDLLLGNNSYQLYLTAQNDETLLELEQSLATAIHQLSSQASITATSNWVPSEQRQQANYQLLTQQVNQQLFAEINALLTEDISFEPTETLSLAEASQSPIAPLIANSYFSGSEAVFSMVQVANIERAALVTAIEPYLPQIKLVEKSKEISAILTTSRENLMHWFMLAIALFLIVLLWQFGFGFMVKCMSIIGITVLFSLSFSFLVQGSLNIFNVLALLLILALSIDYLIFYRKRQLAPMNVIAITLSALSSIFVFGLLVFSQTPAIFGFGLSVMIGLVSIYFTAPLITSKDYEKRL
ncbi:MMPL family transporter [Thalassotalea fusca]